MQYVDRNTNSARLDESIRPLIESILYNKRIFSSEDGDPPFVTEAVKYRSKPQKRRQTSPYKGDNEFVSNIIELFGFDPLDFQVESWETVNKLDRRRKKSGQSQAAIFSAPTGFGKTEAFLGSLYQLLREDRQDGTAIVYPSRALLQDQLGRVLKHIHDINQNNDTQLSVGVYVGEMPYKLGEVGSNERFFNTEPVRPRFKLANCWCGSKSSPNNFELRSTAEGYLLRCEANHNHSFTDRELVLSRQDMVFDNSPDIVLTTLESLEGFALKPNYTLIDDIETIVFDEVHLNTQLRGAHASKIIHNIDELTDHPILWLGSSATINNPSRFGKKLFGTSNISVITPGDSDFDDDHNDREHYYFILTARDGPGVSSTFIQQHLLFGHSLLESSGGERSKMLSFIDSISQVNQKYTQLIDADHSQSLWEYHTEDGRGGDWPLVAKDMGNQFIHEPLQFMEVYSERGFDSTEVAQSDVLLSTSFLEVGINVGKINTIMQYRTPQNLSALQQRAGRAAREEGTDAHIAVTLSDLTGDSNMFYRASRFLDSDIKTPLNVDNEVVEWIHERFGEYYSVANEIHSQSNSDGHHELFIDSYIGSQLGYDAYKQFILDPQRFLNNELDIDISADQLLSEEGVDEVSKQIETSLTDLQSEFEEIESLFHLNEGNVVRGKGAIKTYLRNLRQQLLELIDSFSDQLSKYETALQSPEHFASQAEIEEYQSELSDLRISAAEPPENSAETKLQFYQSLIGELYKLNGEFIQLQITANQVSENYITDNISERLDQLWYAVSKLIQHIDSNQLQRYYTTQKKLLYLEKTLQELSQYVEYRNPYESLYAIRHLLRGAYYFDRYLQIDDRSMGEVWYVPPNYYGDAGLYFSVFKPNGQMSDDVSIDEILGKYAPYKPKYQPDSNEMHLFLPPTTTTDDGVVFDFSEDVDGGVQDGILVPNSIELSSVTDYSGEAAKSIVRYCPECYQILSSNSCLRHDEHDYGKIFSTPQVSTTVTNRSIVGSTGSISLADLTARATLDGVSLDIRPASEWNGSVKFDGRDAKQVQIDSPTETLGFTLDTRGIIFDIDSFIDRISNSDVKSIVERYNDIDEIGYEELAYHTAAHFLVQVAADVSAVNPSMLFYGYDMDKKEVYVFERSEGGQGIIDLVYDDLASDPETILEGIIQTGYNSQVINERLWADSSFVDSLPVDPEDEDAIESAVTDYINVPFNSVIERTVQEVFSTIDKANQFAISEEISLGDAYSIKQTIAQAQIRGETTFPNEAVTTVAKRRGIALSDLDQCENVFFSPDIDGCVENLHLAECMASNSQSNSLSYVMLEALREELLYMSSGTDTPDAAESQEVLMAGVFQDTNVYLSI